MRKGKREDGENRGRTTWEIPADVVAGMQLRGTACGKIGQFWMEAIWTHLSNLSKFAGGVADRDEVHPEHGIKQQLGGRSSVDGALPRRHSQDRTFPKPDTGSCQTALTTGSSVGMKDGRCLDGVASTGAIRLSALASTAGELNHPRLYLPVAWVRALDRVQSGWR